MATGYSEISRNWDHLSFDIILTVKSTQLCTQMVLRASEFYYQYNKVHRHTIKILTICPVDAARIEVVRSFLHHRT